MSVFCFNKIEYEILLLTELKLVEIWGKALLVFFEKCTDVM